MTDLNSVCLIGRVVKDPEVTKKDDLCITNFTIAVNRDKKKGDEWKEEVSFVDLTLFGKRADSLSKWIKKGCAVSVVAHIEQDRWEKDGNKFSRLKVVPDQVNPFIERRQDNGKNASEESDCTTCTNDDDYPEN